MEQLPYSTLVPGEVAHNILLRYITRYPTLEIQYSKILSGGIDFISENQRIHYVVYTGQVSGHLNDKKFSHVGVL